MVIVLINQIYYLNRLKRLRPEFIDKIIDISQSPIGRTPRSNPVTYTGIFTPIRELFAETQDARSRGYKPGALVLMSKEVGVKLRGGWNDKS